jgi:adenylate cyclase, class 2
LKFEIEIKLRLPDKLEKIRRALRDHGFRVSKSRVHESNVLFDTPKRLLRSHGKLIRVRRVGAHTVLTFKGPSQPGRYKKRQEIEMSFPDTSALEQILNEIGYHPIFRYEKFRTEYAKAPGAGKVMLDETPVRAGSTAPRDCSAFRRTTTSRAATDIFTSPTAENEEPARRTCCSPRKI